MFFILGAGLVIGVSLGVYYNRPDVSPPPIPPLPNLPETRVRALVIGGGMSGHAALYELSRLGIGNSSNLGLRPSDSKSSFP